MSSPVYRYQFEADVPLDEAEAALLLAIVAAEALHGQPAVRLGVRYLFGEGKRACVIDGAGKMARHVALIFTQFLIREFGENAFQVTQPARQRPAARRSAGGKAVQA